MVFVLVRRIQKRYALHVNNLEFILLQMTKPSPQKIAVIGSGITGLHAAYLLQKAGHAATLFEKLPKAGMAAHGVDFNGSNQSLYWGDVPSRMFNPLEWSELYQLYKDIGVETETVDPTQSFSTLSNGECQTYLNLKAANSPFANFSQIFRPKRLRTLLEAKRLFNIGRKSLKTGVANDLSFHSYLVQNKFSERFCREFLYPNLTSTVCTCTPEVLDNYPAALVLRLLDHITHDKHHQERLLKTRFGTLDVVSRLASQLQDIRYGVDIVSVKQINNRVEVSTKDQGAESFDHAVMATQANHCLKLVADLSTDEETFLQGFSYHDVEVIIHTDDTFMPKNKNLWSTFNMHTLAQAPKRSVQSSMCTVWMNRFHKNWQVDSEVFQSIMPITAIDESKVIRRVRLQRPAITKDSYRLWDLYDQKLLDPRRRVWFCGSYAERGIPLLETGIRSSRKVANAIDLNEPSPK